MNIDYTVTALMFPAIPLIMSVYSNRFHTLSSLIRKIHDEFVFEKHTPPEWKAQLINLDNRIVIGLLHNGRLCKKDDINLVKSHQITGQYCELRNNTPLEKLDAGMGDIFIKLAR